METPTKTADNKKVFEGEKIKLDKETIAEIKAVKEKSAKTNQIIKK